MSFLLLLILSNGSTAILLSGASFTRNGPLEASAPERVVLKKAIDISITPAVASSTIEVHRRRLSPQAEATDRDTGQVLLGLPGVFSEVSAIVRNPCRVTG